MTKPLEHEVIIITGASRGIGAATALVCSKQGARVVLAARTRESLESIARQL
jgi:NADP-dependent 3-hydroxy acid dehydrogenase YdfG